MNSIIKAKDFSFCYNDSKEYAVKHINFEIKEGSFTCIIGANGAGKSTLCNSLVGLIPHYFNGSAEGLIEVSGLKVEETTISELSRSVGLVFQNPFNQLSYTADSVAEELAYGLGNYGVPREEIIHRVQEIARIMRLEEVLDRNPLQLSGGQAQRVALGSTFIMKPKVLVLDECTTQLDPLGSEEIFNIVKRLNAEGITILMVDHDMGRIARCADTVIVLDNGEIVLKGTPYEIFTSPELSSYNITPPEYVDICRALIEENAYLRKIEITEMPTIKAVRAALRKEAFDEN